MYTSLTTQKPQVIWQGLTKDGYTVMLTRAGMTRISSSLKHAGLENLVKSNMNGDLEDAIVRLIAQVVSNATRSGTLSRPDSGTKIQVFTTVGRTRSYQILTQPLGSGQAGIISIRSQPREILREGEQESESELEQTLQEGEHEAGRLRRPDGLSRKRGGKSKQATRGRGFYRKVNTQFQWNNVPDQVRKKVNEIVLMKMPAQNKVEFTDKSKHSYWRAGNHRIFGDFTQDGFFNFVGYGQHQGKTNNVYNVTLPNGTTRAKNK